MFAGVLLLLAGGLSLIDGIAAIGNSHFFASHPRYILGSLHVWGWIGVIIGVVQLAAGFGILVKNQLSRWAGVVVLAGSAIAEPLCILAMYGLVVHGHKISPPRG
jgi:hypothetical protein